MKRSIVVAGLLALGVTAALAQSNAVEQRQALMKEMAAQTRTLGGMMRGQAPFDLAKVQEGLKVFSENSKKAAALFPESTKDAAKTEALPTIWQNKSQFESHFAKLDQAAQAAISTIKDEATLKSELPKVLGNCGGCHNDFRKKS